MSSRDSHEKNSFGQFYFILFLLSVASFFACIFLIAFRFISWPWVIIPAAIAIGTFFLMFFTGVKIFNDE